MLVVAVAAVAAYFKFDWLSAQWRAHVGGGSSAGVTSTTSAPPQSAMPAAISSAPQAPSTAAPAGLIPLVTSESTSASAAAPVPMINSTGAHKAPPGYVYVLRRLSKVTDSGIMAIDAGSKVALLTRGKTTTTVTDGNSDFVVENRYVTDDADVAGMAQRVDPQSQSALAAWIQQNKGASR